MRNDGRMQRDPAVTARRLFESPRRRPAEPAVVATLLLFGQGALAYAARRGIRILLLRPGELYREASAALARLGIDVDAWPAPPAGLFVVEERALYLRSRSPMTVAHEFGHALDCALGGGVYRSGIDPQVRALFANAQRLRDSLRGDRASTSTSPNRCAPTSKPTTAASPWPRATRARLRHIDPGMHDYVEMLFEIEFGERPNLGEVVSI